MQNELCIVNITYMYNNEIRITTMQHTVLGTGICKNVYYIEFKPKMVVVVNILISTNKH